MKNSAGHSILVIYDAQRRAIGGRLRFLGALSQIAVAAAAFYTVWWPVDSWLTTTLLMKMPLFSRTYVSEAWDALVSGPTVEAPPNAGPPAVSSSRKVTEGDDPDQRRFYPSRQRPSIMLSTFYGWEALMAVGVCLCAYAGGAGIGAGLSAPARRFLSMIVKLGSAGLIVWVVIAVVRMRGQFAISTGEVGIGWLAGLSALLGAAIGRGARMATVLSGVWSFVVAAGGVAGLILWDRCDALEPEFRSNQFIALVFAALSAYGWLTLAWAVWSHRSAGRGFVPYALPVKRA